MALGFYRFPNKLYCLVDLQAPIQIPQGGEHIVCFVGHCPFGPGGTVLAHIPFPAGRGTPFMANQNARHFYWGKGNVTEFPLSGFSAAF